MLYHYVVSSVDKRTHLYLRVFQEFNCENSRFTRLDSRPLPEATAPSVRMFGAAGIWPRRKEAGQARLKSERFFTSSMLFLCFSSTQSKTHETSHRLDCNYHQHFCDCIVTLCLPSAQQSARQVG